MPLYWYTDKPIGKYRLKKPIPVKYVYNYEDSGVDMFDGGYLFDGQEENDEQFIYDLERMLDGDFTKDSDGNIIQREVEFIKQVKEYLEEIK